MNEWLPLFLPDDPSEARRVFNELPLKSQVDLLLQCRGKERLRILFLSDRPEQLVEHLPELEVFLTIKEAGESDAAELIALTTPDQFQYLLDLNLWKKDVLDTEKVLRWMEILLQCGMEKVSQFIQHAETGLIALILRRFLRVMVFEGEPVETAKRFSLFTLDQFFFVQFVTEEARKTLQPFLERLYLVNPELYRRIMEASIWEIASELEEEEYRLKNARLADFGFPALNEALEIYRFVPPDSAASEKQEPVSRRGAASEKGSPTYYLTFRHEGPFFSSVLSKVVDRDEENRLKEELTALCNKALIAEALEAFTLEEMSRVARRVFHMLNLGLETISRKDEARALDLLLSLPLQRVFQSGVSMTLLLRRKASTILNGSWFGGDQGNLVFLDSPFLETMGGLLRKRPVLYEQATFRDFETLRDVRAAEGVLKSVEAIVGVVGRTLALHPQTLKQLDLTSCHPTEWREITFSTIFLTALANQVLHGAFRFEAIDQREIEVLRSRVLKEGEHGRRGVTMDIQRGLKEWLDSIENEEERRQHLLAFWDFCLDLFVEEFGRVPTEETIDARYVKGLLIRG